MRTADQRFRGTTKSGTAIVKLAKRKRKKKRQMSWFKNLFKSKKSKQAIETAAEEEFRRIIESFKERIEESNHAPNKKAHPAGTEKKPAPKTATAKKPVAPKATTSKPATKPVVKKATTPTATKTTPKKK